MGQLERRMYVYSVQAIRLEVPDDGKDELIRLDADPQQVFDGLEHMAVPKNAPNSSKLLIGDQSLAVDIQKNNSDDVRGRFHIEKQGASGRFFVYDAQSGVSVEREVKPTDGEELNLPAHFIYLPKSKIIALEWTQGVPHAPALAAYLEQMARSLGIDIEEIKLSKMPIASPIEKILQVDFAEKMRIKMPAASLSKIEGETSIAQMLRSHAQYQRKSGTFEIEVSAERTKSGRHDVFPKIEIRDFWLDNREMVTKLIVNEKMKDQIYFGENHLIFTIKVEESFGNINATQLLDDAKQRMNSAGWI